MAYTRLHWEESVTPLSAENMNNIEDGIEGLQNQKVDKVSGKGLSTNDYTTEEKNKLASVLSLVYPVGSIYMSVNSTNPGTLFGGTWVQLENRFLLGAGSSYSNGATGGAASVTLSTANLPSHTHEMPTHAVFEDDTASADLGYASVLYNKPSSGTYQGFSITHSETTKSTGSRTAHNNMPPYLVVYMWKRTA